MVSPLSPVTAPLPPPPPPCTTSNSTGMTVIKMKLGAQPSSSSVAIPSRILHPLRLSGHVIHLQFVQWSEQDTMFACLPAWLSSKTQSHLAGCQFNAVPHRGCMFGSFATLTCSFASLLLLPYLAKWLPNGREEQGWVKRREAKRGAQKDDCAGEDM